MTLLQLIFETNNNIEQLKKVLINLDINTKEYNLINSFIEAEKKHLNSLINQFKA